MQNSPCVAAVGVAGLILCTLSLVRLSPVPASGVPFPVDADPLPLRPSRTASEAMRREAWHHWLRAQLAVNEERYALEAWDPRALARIDPEVWRLRQMAQDPRGDLRRARWDARRAAALARTSADRYLAARLLALLGRPLVDHREGLRQARLLPRTGTPAAPRG